MPNGNEINESLQIKKEDKESFAMPSENQINESFQINKEVVDSNNDYLKIPSFLNSLIDRISGMSEEELMRLKEVLKDIDSDNIRLRKSFGEDSDPEKSDDEIEQKSPNYR